MNAVLKAEEGLDLGRVQLESLSLFRKASTLPGRIRRAGYSLPPDLVGSLQLEDIANAMLGWPGTLSNQFTFEVRLGDSDQVDFEMWASLGGGWSYPRGTFRHSLAYEGGHRVGNFLNWLTTGKEEKGFWLEFDIVDGRPRPSIFFHPSREWLDLTRLTAYERAAISTLAGDGALERTKRAIRSVVESEGVVTGLGVMNSRPGGGVRVVVDLPLTQVRWLLRRLRYDGPDYEDALEIAAEAPSAMLAFDLTEEGISPRIGFELRTHARSAGFGLGYGPLIRSLEKRGACLPAKAAALIEFADSRSPDPAVLTNLNSLKVIQCPDGSIEAKAYLFTLFH